MPTRGIRGATTVTLNRADEILDATRELLEAMVSANALAVDDLACAYFTVTPDLDAGFPAAAARQLGWTQVPMLDSVEIPVPGGLKRCIRVMLQWNTDKTASEVRHIYHREAESLRPELVEGVDQHEEMTQ